jgi:uncharacterized protein
VSKPEHSHHRNGLLPTEPVRWGIPAAAIGLILSEAAIVGVHLLRQIPGFPHTDGIGVALQAGFYIFLAGYVILIARWRGLGTPKKDFGFDLHWIDLPIGIALAIAAHFAIEISATFAVGVLGLPRDYGSNAVLPSTRIWAIVDGLAVASFLAPVVEELFFRGLVLRAIRNLVVKTARRGGERSIRRAQWISIVVSATIFAAVHLYEARSPTELVVLAISVFLFGLGAGWIATRTGRLGPSMIAHMINNTLVVVSLLSASST